MQSSKRWLLECSSDSLGTLTAKKESQTEMKFTLSEIKKNLQGTNSGMYEAKNQINDLEHKEEKNIQSEKQEEKQIQKYEDNVSSLWGNLKHSNICIIGVPEGE